MRLINNSKKALNNFYRTNDSSCPKIGLEETLAIALQRMCVLLELCAMEVCL